MTREEAIAILGKYKRYSESIYTNGVLDAKAFDMAIEALSAEQTEYKLPGHDEVMEALDKMTLRGDKE